MSLVDAFSNSVGEYLLAFGALFLKIEIWTHGEIVWGIMSCIFGFAFLFRRFLAERLVLFFPAHEPRGHQEIGVNGALP